MTEQDQNPGRKWRGVENEGSGEKHNDNFRFTPYTTDIEFFRDPNIYETEVARATDTAAPGSTDTKEKPRGLHRSDEQIRDEIKEMLASQAQVDASHIQVDVQDGIVTLAGHVHSEDEVGMARRIVQNVFGVRGLKNKIEVRAQDVP